MTKRIIKSVSHIMHTIRGPQPVQRHDSNSFQQVIQKVEIFQGNKKTGNANTN